MSNTLIVILGPTGVGKTELCLRLADYFHIPIVNADSRQLFAEIPIGTAAPTAEQQKRVKHYFVGNLHLTDYYSASKFEEDAMKLFQQLFADEQNHHHLALMSGGSMMYIDAVCNGIDDIPTVDESTRRLMKQRLADEGLPALVEELRQLDPEHWAIVDRNNPRRVVHALEICHMTGQTYTSFRKKERLHASESNGETNTNRPFRIVKIGLTRPREELYERINQRVLKMIADGLVEEARSVFPLRHLNALNTVGYKELFEHFEGKTTLDEAIFKIQSNTRRYCRKQLTWFKRDAQIHWFDLSKMGNDLQTASEKIIKYIESLV
jgi:tRNA dimethylallyltransferase